VSKTKKQRVDVLLVELGLAESRSRAQALVLAGKVYCGDRRVNKAGESFGPDAPLTVRGRDHPWVSRGGLKLAHAIAHFGLDLENAVCLDLGASTGGFTDVLLHNGAARVYAVDVGRGQLAWSLRQDARVVALEATNARDLTERQIPEKVDAITCDVSFIGLEKALPAAMTFARPGAILVALIKPQFQAGRDKVGKGGVVRDPAVWQEVCETVQLWITAQSGWRVLGVTESPIRGPKGNREFLIAARFES